MSPHPTPTQTTFKFNENDNCVFEKKIQQQDETMIYLKLEQINQSIAIIKFTDENHKIIDIPSKCVVLTKNVETNQYFTHPPTNYFYVLCFTDEYIVSLNDEVVLKIKNKREWDIVS